MQTISAVLFDMDGVLADTQKIHFAAERMTCAHFGVKVTDAMLVADAGRPDSQSFREWAKKQLGEAAIGDDMFAYKYQTAMPALIAKKGIPPIDGADALVRFATKNFSCAVASSSPRRFINLVIQSLGFENLLTIRISADDLPMGRGKPHPDIYLLAAKAIGADPTSCIAIEDAALGVEAAKEAGMRCIGFQSVGSGAQDLSRADWVIGDLHDAIPLLHGV